MSELFPLTLSEQADLKRYEATIQRGLDTFVAVGNALLAIRRERLYRLTHATFEFYCEQRWQMTRHYANRLIAASAVVGNLVPIGTILPVTESQARPLTQLEPDQQREKWQEVIETAPNGKVTAAHVQRVVDEYKEPGSPLGPDSLEYDSDEWYTPLELIEAAREVMGSIDLDPASSHEAQKVIQANTYYTQENDGLMQDWIAKSIWLNPPYSEPRPWVEKVIESLDAGSIECAILLVNTANSPLWARPLWRGRYAVCLLERRVRFWRPDRLDAKGFDRDQMIWYLGNDSEKFRSVFAAYGAIR